MKSLTPLMAIALVAAAALGQSETPTSAPAKSQADAKAQTPTTRPAGRDKPDTAPPKARRDILTLLNSRVPKVEFDETPLKEVMEWVARYTGAMVYVRWKVLEELGIERETPITLKGRNKPLSLILRVIMKEAEGTTEVTLAYEASSELFTFSTEPDFERGMLVRIYDVKDIIVDVPIFEGPEDREGTVYRTRVVRKPRREEIHSPSGEVIIIEDPRRELVIEDKRMRELVDLILMTIAPETWEINDQGGQGIIFPYKGRLVVRNSRRVHELIAGRQP